MRRLILLTVLGAIGFLTTADSGSALGRRRWRCSPQVVPYAAATQPAVPASKLVTFPNGMTHRITHTGEFFASRETGGATAAAVITARRAAAGDDDFAGTQRMLAKTSIAKANVETFTTVEDLLVTLPADAKMMKHQPMISKAKDSDRVEEEKRNVTVSAHLYAASREADNDFHLIIGGDPADEGRLYMNVEVSGLPPDDPFRQALQVPRKQFKDFFAANLPGAGYVRFDPPIPVRVSGSLFYDISHAPGVVGPTDHKPHSSWEIHPVTKIEFLDKATAAAPGKVWPTASSVFPIGTEMRGPGRIWDIDRVDRVSAVVTRLKMAGQWKPAALSATLRPLTPVAAKAKEAALRKRIEASAQKADVSYKSVHLVVVP